MLQLVVPQADSFGVKAGRPPVFPAFRRDPDGGAAELVGYAFLTPDVPPERVGYSGPIDALVGLGLDGQVTGVRVVYYYESYMSQMGDFLRTPGFQEQYSGKHINDRFLVHSDIDGISRATVSVRALSRGVRDAARRVAAEYLSRAPPSSDVVDASTLPWFELLNRGVVRSLEVKDGAETVAEIYVAHVDSWATGEHLVGPSALGMTRRAVESRDGQAHVMVYGVDGSNVMVFQRVGWSVAQGPDTFALASGAVFPFGLAGAGVMEDEMPTLGAIILPGALDMERPFTLSLDLPPELGRVATDYTPLAARAAPPAPEPGPAPEPASPEPELDAEPAPEPPASDRSDPEVPAPDPEPVGAPAPEESAVPVDTDTVAVAAGSDTTVEPALDFSLSEEETALEHTLAGISWGRTGATAALLLLVSIAFVLKHTGLRWATLAITLGYLGFVDGGFLSVSHITSGMWVGASAFVSDVPLGLIAGFTVVTTLVFGRVFCGFLCPFGALQDFLSRFVPRRLQRRVPEAVHRPALWIKYGVLVVVLTPALLGSHVSLYQYFEPFGTVFFQSPSLVLWGIALTFVAASAVVPRFYCRYACPLGAALALGSTVALKRIGRVEHCTHCKVCENQCPTGAIRGADIDFKECVRCNRCETNLVDEVGVCRHDMDRVRPRLVQLQVQSRSGESHVA